MLSDGLIGALIGGGATVLVSAMTQFIVVRNLNKQHAHDAKQKAEDRKAVLRREIYFKLIDDFEAFQRFIADFYMESPYEAPRTAFETLLSSANKALLIAERETAFQIETLVKEIGNALIAIGDESFEVRVAYSKRAVVISRFDVAEAEWRAADEYIRRATLDPLQKDKLGDLAADLVRKEQYKERLRKEIAGMFDKSDPVVEAFFKMKSKRMEMSLAAYQHLLTAMRADVGVGPRVFPELEKKS